MYVDTDFWNKVTLLEKKVHKFGEGSQYLASNLEVVVFLS